MLFRDRVDAGRRLAQKLQRYANRSDTIILGLPRGGVPVAYEVAKALNAPLDVFLVRKLGMPGHEELAIGAIASGGVRVINDEIVRRLEFPDEVIASVADQEQAELERREKLYRDDRPVHEVRDRIVILVDDGLATGSSMRAAVAALHQKSPGRIVVAVPVGAADTCAELRDLSDEVVCVKTPTPFCGVGMWYDDFSQTSDDEVRELLKCAAAEHALASTEGSGTMPQ